MLLNNTMEEFSDCSDAMIDDSSDVERPCSSSSGIRSTFKDESKKYKRGIVYLSFIPPGMNVQILSHILSKYGDLGRIMLQPAKSGHASKKSKKKKATKQQLFTEGWVEFLKKKTAKQVAATLNNTQIGGKKKSKFHDYIWNIKYLSRFKWVHLSERITYERAVYKQRMHTEINQAKKVASHFIDKVDAAEKLSNKKNPEQSNTLEKDWQMSKYFKQKETDKEKVAKQKKNRKNENRENFLKNLFS